LIFILVHPLLILIAIMEASNSHSFRSRVHLFVLFLLCFVVTIEANLKKVPAFYVFGDSTVDSGNNNFIDTAFRSDFPPYGRDFVNQAPTGRFTNGKLGTDFVGITSLFMFLICMLNMEKNVFLVFIFLVKYN